LDHQQDAQDQEAVSVADCQLVMHEVFLHGMGFLSPFSVDSTFGCVVIQQAAQVVIDMNMTCTYHETNFKQCKQCCGWSQATASMSSNSSQ
jgi:hypothetical protein